MQAVILAAGEGVRMRPLTLERPKPLIEVAGKPIIAHIIEALPSTIDEVIVVIGYKGEMIREYLGESFAGRRIVYVPQGEAKGTAQALLSAEPSITGRFLLLNGDDLHGPRALAEAARHPLAILVARHDDPSKFGVVERRADGTLAGITEKPEAPASNLVSTGALMLDKRIFDYPAERHTNGEYYLTDSLALLAAEHSISVVEQGFWAPIGYPEDIPRAEQLLANRAYARP